jgi:peptide deformylase
MTIKDVLFWPHEALRMKAEPVKEGEDLTELLEDLKDTSKAYNAEGIAATQIGVNKRVVLVHDEDRNEIILINPEIVRRSSDRTSALEGCLSFPGVSERIERASFVQVKGTLESGEELTYTATGLEAVALQHELDHLDGVVMLDYMGKIQKRMALKKLNKTKRLIRDKKRAEEKQSKLLRKQIRDLEAVDAA